MAFDPWMPSPKNPLFKIIPTLGKIYMLKSQTNEDSASWEMARPHSLALPLFD